MPERTMVRRICVLLAVALLATACARAERLDVGTATPAPSTPPVDAGGPGDAASGGSADDASGDRSGSGPRSDAEPGQGSSSGAEPAGGSPPSFDDAGNVGENALAYLRASFPKLVIEVDSVSGAQPAASSLDHLRSSLAEVLDKPDGIDVASGETFPAPKDRYSADDLRAVERAHRRSRTGGDSASLYVLFVNGSYANDPQNCPNGSRCTLGLAYSASSYAIFSDAVAAAASGTLLVTEAEIERAVVLHEAGHILRLVNIGYRSPRDHEDPDHPHHSRNEDSVMYWAVESQLVITELDAAPPDTFDAADKADLADLKAGRL